MKREQEFREAITDALTTVCGRCNGKGTESWQKSRDPADGREDWPCVRCSGKGSVTDDRAIERVIGAVAAVLSSDDSGAVAE